MTAQPTEAGPILFSGAMIRAILEDRKRMTRRVMNPQPSPGFLARGLVEATPQWPYQDGVRFFMADGCSELVKSPFKPGTRRWVQETHTNTDCVFDTFAGKEAWHVCGYYDADQSHFEVKLTERESGLFTERKKKKATVPGRFMYRSLSRITLEIESVKVERLQAISEADAIAEGISRDDGAWASYDKLMHRYTIPERSFQSLWDSIHAKAGHGWDTNPWCWCVAFRRVQP